jgi:transposase-like protein
VGPKHFQNKARREWWSIHIEAWQRSGLSQRRYCVQQRLTEETFRRWRRVLTDAKALQTKAELLREKQRERRRKRHIRLSSDMRSKAVQAFWAMHVEAMTWCGMSAQSYARAHRLSLHSLKRWRGLLDAGEVAIDWRSYLHPSALPQISSGVSSAAKESSARTGLTDRPIVDPPRDGRTNRRRFSDKEKLAIVQESDRPDANAAEVCRRHGIVTSMLFRWRVQFGFGMTPRAKLAAVMLVEAQSTASSAPLVLHDLLQPPDGMMTVQLGDGRRVFAPIDSDPNAVRRHVAERETTR